MGDTYRPARRRGGADYDRDERYDYYERPDRYSHMDHDGRYPRSPPSDPRQQHGRDNGQFNFRGAADRDRYQPGRRPEEHFTFRSHGPSAPRFPSRSPIPRERSPKPQTRRTQGARPGRSNQELNGQRGGRRQGGRGRGGFAPRAAHNRDILKQPQRGSTPEQLAGMNADGQPRFMNVDVSDEEDSDDDDNVVDLTQDTDDDDDDRNQAPRKRAKVQPSIADVAAPKWSNPDPYTALPPPATLGAPKVDVVQLIRKAKVNVDPFSRTDTTNAVKNNVDFVSFNDASEEGEASDNSSVKRVSPPRGAPSAPSVMRSFQPVNGNQRSNNAATSPPKSNHTLFQDLSPDDDMGSPPLPPNGLLMPTEEELVANYGGPPKGRKRKRAEQSRDLGSILPEWDPDGSNPTPWLTDHSHTGDPGLRLHDEICDFFQFVRPYDHEDEVRMNLVYRVESAVKDSGINNSRFVSVDFFGSFATGLYLPIADMDLVVISDNYRLRGHKTFCQTHNSMRKLGRHLEMTGIAAPGTLSWVLGAKVPIIKFTDRATGIKVDISFENDTGLKAVRTLKQWKEQYPAMPVMVLLIKQLLAMRGLNEVFTGGLGGFSIICLVVSMMQLTPEIQTRSMDSQEYYGNLFLDFLDLYGNKIDIVRTGINMNPPGYFDKIRNPARKQNALNLTIIDPNNSSNDISGGSRNILEVLALFSSAHAAIQHRLAQVDGGKDADGSILGCILGGNYGMFRSQRDKLSRLHRGLEVSPPPVPQRKHDSKPEGKLPRRARRLFNIQKHQQAAAPPPPPLPQREQQPKRGPPKGNNMR